MTDLNLDQLARAEAFGRAREILGDVLPSEIIAAASWIYDGSHVAEALPPTAEEQGYQRTSQDGLWEPIRADDDTSSIPSLDDLPQVPAND